VTLALCVTNFGFLAVRLFYEFWFSGHSPVISAIFDKNSWRSYVQEVLFALTSCVTLARAVLLNGSETWTFKARDARRITAADMKYMRRRAGYTWTDYKTNTQIAKELKITPVLDKLLEYKRNWLQHVNRMPRNRLHGVIKHYFPTGRRNHGRPMKRLLDT